LGRIIESTGDGFFVTFDHALSGIRCAVRIVNDVQSLGLHVRAGLHIGDCQIFEGGVSGLTVNIGARVAQQAADDEVWVSSTLRQFVIGSGVQFLEKGMHVLKGIPERWSLYSVGAGVS
jgi:class 3 adenylate cyclase